MISPKQFVEFREKFVELAVAEYSVNPTRIEELFEEALEALLLDYARIEIERKLAAVRPTP